MNLKKSFLNLCENKEYEVNENQISIVEKLSEYYNLNFYQTDVGKYLILLHYFFAFTGNNFCNYKSDFNQFGIITGYDRSFVNYQI